MLTVSITVSITVFILTLMFVGAALYSLYAQPYLVHLLVEIEKEKEAKKGKTAQSGD